MDENIVKYIQDSLTNKIPLEQIKQNLIAAGWSQSQIDEAISSVNPSEKQEKKKFPVVIPIVAGILIIFGIVIFLLIKTPTIISENQLTNGTSVDLGTGESIKFQLTGQTHSILINSMAETSANLVIQSSTINAVFNINQTQTFDLNNDGKKDFSITLVGVVNNRADLFIKKITGCDEIWNCTDWSNCTNGAQTRTCSDLNLCGTEINEPIEIQNCTVQQIISSCAQQGGKLCDLNEICNGTISNSSNGNCCVGNCQLNAEMNCSGMNCLIDASNTCNIATLIYNSTTHKNGWIQNDSVYFKIRGITDGKCVLYMELLHASGAFDSAILSSFTANGTSSDDVAAQEQQTNIDIQSTVGSTEICRFQPYDLNAALSDIKDSGNLNAISENIQLYGCTGDLFV